MGSIYKTILFMLLRLSMTEEGLSKDIKNCVDEKIIEELYRISKKHDVSHLIGYALDKNDLFLKDSDAKKIFLKECSLAVCRYEQSQYEFQQLCKVLEMANIPFVPLKGNVIRKYYPEPWMRTSCDIDILVRKEQVDYIKELLEEKLLYAYDGKGDHDISLIAESGVRVELHYQLLEDSAKKAEKDVLDNVWDFVQKEGEIESLFKMPDEYFYCYHIAHIAKHLRYGGCGVRSIIDTWILNHKVSYDKEKRNDLLSRAGLLAVSKAIEKLADVWFSNENYNELSERLSNYILEGGVYGTFDNKVAAQQTKNKSKISYLLSRVFLPYRQMKFKYPRLQKCPILYPFYVIKRFFSLFNRKKRGLALREIEQTINPTQRQKEVERLMQDLELI